jgi:uncharacterized protein YggE
MRLSIVVACAGLALPLAVHAQGVDSDEINRNLQGGQGNLPAPTIPMQDQDKRNGTITLQGGRGNVPVTHAIPAPVELHEGGIISVEGRGKAAGPPDMAVVNSGVTTQATTAREALEANTAATTQLIATLREAGIEKRDIQTSGFSVSPQYVYSDARDPSGNTPPPRIVGYRVANSVTIRVRDLTSLGVVLDRAVTVGANTIGGVSLTIDDPAALYAEARRKAFGEAVAKAGLYAELAQVELGEIASISEAIGLTPPQSYPIGALARDAAAAAVPIESGELSYSVTVQVTWKLEQGD